MVQPQAGSLQCGTSSCIGKEQTERVDPNVLTQTCMAFIVYPNLPMAQANREKKREGERESKGKLLGDNFLAYMYKKCICKRVNCFTHQQIYFDANTKRIR